MPENRYGFCGTRPTARDSGSGSRSRTSTPSTSTAPPVASNSRGTRLSSVVLPLPVLPMTAVVSPGAADEVDVAQHRLLGARVAELDVAQLQRRRAAAGRVTGVGGGDHAGLGVEHLLDALGADLGPRDHART